MEPSSEPSRDYSVSGLPPEQLGPLSARLEADPRVASVTAHEDHTGALAFLRVTLRDEVARAEIGNFLREYGDCFPDLLLEPNVPFSFGGPTLHLP